ncbi:MAG: Crp/Fnr family transcriptional regulator [Xanthobacteraceae bacterium]
MTPADWTIVNRVPVFRSMRDALSHRIIRSHARGELLFQQGDPATFCFLVLDGWVKLYRQTTDGDEVVVSLFTAGESFAEAMMFRGGRYPATAEAVTSVRLLHIDGQSLRDAILRNPQISFDMLAASSLHLRRLVEQVEQLKAQSAPKRIAGFLLSLTAARRGPARIELPYEKLLIANRLGMKPESFSRALRQLRNTGVFVEREFVRIDDVTRLSTFVDGDETGDVPCRMIRTPAQCGAFGPGCIETAYPGSLRPLRRPRP